MILQTICTSGSLPGCYLTPNFSLIRMESFKKGLPASGTSEFIQK